MSNLRQWGFMKVQLQPLDHIREITSVETHYVFGNTRRIRPKKQKRGTKVVVELCGKNKNKNFAMVGLPTLLQSTRPSARRQLPWSGVRNLDQCDRRGPGSDPQTASLWARWSWAATAAGSSPRWWSCERKNKTQKPLLR